MNKNIGITLGKMSPMHKGHELLINEALKIVDVLYVVLYHTPDITSIPLNIRAGWINQIYDENEVKVILGWFAPNEHESTDRVKRMQEKYIGNLMKDVSLTHFISSETYGEHMSTYLGIENICLDIDRIELGIYATDIRKNIKNNKEYLNSHVYFDLLQKFLIVGNPKDTENYIKSLELQKDNERIQECTEFEKTSISDLKSIQKRSLNRLQKLKSTKILNLDYAVYVKYSIINDIVDVSKQGLHYHVSMRDIAGSELSQYDHVIVLDVGDPIYVSAVIDCLKTIGIQFHLLNARDATQYIKNNYKKTKIFQNEKK